VMKKGVGLQIQNDQVTIPLHREFIKGAHRTLGLTGHGPVRGEVVRAHQIPYRQLLGDEQTGDAFGVTQGYPTTFVIDAAGRIRTKMLGSPPTKFEVLQDVVDKAVAS